VTGPSLWELEKKLPRTSVIASDCDRQNNWCAGIGTATIPLQVGSANSNASRADRQALTLSFPFHEAQEIIAGEAGDSN
jgi:hypothetical protein